MYRAIVHINWTPQTKRGTKEYKTQNVRRSGKETGMHTYIYRLVVSDTETIDGEQTNHVGGEIVG